MSSGLRAAETIMGYGAYGVPFKLEVLTRHMSELESEAEYGAALHELAKQGLFEVFLLFNGEVDGPEAKSAGRRLPFRLSKEQREQARELFAELWHILTNKKLEQTPLAKARRDKAFQSFLRDLSAKKRSAGRSSRGNRRKRA